MQTLLRQYVLYRIRPFHDGNNSSITEYFFELVRNKTRLWQSVKVKMVDLEFWTVIHFINGKCRTGHFVCAASAMRQTANKSGFTSPQVAHQL